MMWCMVGVVTTVTYVSRRLFTVPAALHKHERAVAVVISWKTDFCNW